MKSIALAACLAALGMAAPAFGAQTIAPNVTVKGRLEKGDAKFQKYFRGDTYTYEARAGEEVWIAWKNVSPGLSASTEVRGPAGFRLTGHTGHDGRTVRFPQAGRYAITIWATGQGEYELSVFPLELATGTTRFSAGQQVRGALSLADDHGSYAKKDTLTYTARAGETVSFRLQGQQSYFLMAITGPDGIQHGAGTANAGETLDVSSSFPTAGDYTVSISGYGGNYTLEARPRLAAASATATPVRLGETVQVRYSTDAAVDEFNRVVDAYTVSAQAGERISIVRNCNCTAIVRGPDGKKVKTTVTSEGKATAGVFIYVERTEFTAPVAGVYRIEAPAYKDNKYDQATMHVVGEARGAELLADARNRVNQSNESERSRVVAALRRGEQLLNAGDNFGANTAFLEALSLDGDNINAKFAAGVANYRIGGPYGFGTAQEYFRDVLRLDPGNAAASANLAAAIEADAAYKRDSEAAYARQQQENRNALANAFNAFAIGVDLGNQINAANAPPPPLPSAPAPLQPLAAAPGRAAPSTGTTQIADPANIRYGCVARSVVTVKERKLDQLVNNCNEPLSVGYFYASGGFRNMQMHDRTPKYLEPGQYTRLTICVQGTLKYDGPNIWCGPKPMDIRTR